MIYDEFKVIIKFLKSAFPQEDFIPDKESMQVWWLTLNDLDIDDLKAAVLRYVETQKFPPKISELRELVAKNSGGMKNDWGESWGLVIRLVSKYGSWRKNEAYAEMDEITRTVVDRMGWDSICMSENLSIERANFKQIYQQYIAQKRDESTMSQNLLGMLNNKMKLLED